MITMKQRLVFYLHTFLFPYFNTIIQILTQDGYEGVESLQLSGLRNISRVEYSGCLASNTFSLGTNKKL